jgi:AcrR family transcriptional regulator
MIGQLAGQARLRRIVAAVDDPCRACRSGCRPPPLRRRPAPGGREESAEAIAVRRKPGAFADSCLGVAVGLVFRPVAGEPASDRRRVRHEATKEEILEAAWALARDRGLTGFSLRDLALAVHMRHQSLYTYFPSKEAIYDAMFAQGMGALVDQRAGLVLDPNPIAALRQAARAFLEFCVEDPVRYQLLFERVVPDFVPSAGSMELSEEALTYLERWHRDAGLTDRADIDLWRALFTGLAGQQIANDPGGTRWTGLADRAIDGLVGTAPASHRKRPTVVPKRRPAASVLKR